MLYYLLFLVNCIIIYRFLSFLNKNFFLSYISTSIIASLIITLSIHFFLKNKTKKIKAREGILLIGVSPDYFPFTYVNDNQKISGIDIDLVEAIAKKLNKKIEFQIMAFDSLIPSLQLGRVDMLIGGLNITDERKRNVLISDPYILYDPLCAISVLKNKIKNIDEIKNKKAITINGYISYDYLKSKNITNEIIGIKSLSEGLLILDMEKGDFYIGNYIAIAQIKNLYDKYNVFIFPDQNNIVGIYFNKNNYELCQKINNIISELKDDGFLEELKNKWHIQ